MPALEGGKQHPPHLGLKILQADAVRRRWRLAPGVDGPRARQRHRARARYMPPVLVSAQMREALYYGRFSDDPFATAQPQRCRNRHRRGLPEVPAAARTDRPSRQAALCHHQERARSVQEAMGEVRDTAAACSRRCS